MELLYVHLPLILVAFVIPLLITATSIAMRFSRQQPYSAGLDILVAKSAVDLPIALTAQSWLPLVSPIFRPAFPAIFGTLAICMIFLFALLVPIEDRLLRYWVGQDLRRRGQPVPQGFQSAFPLARFVMSWFVAIVGLAANVAFFIVR